MSWDNREEFEHNEMKLRIKLLILIEVLINAEKGVAETGRNL